MKFKTIALVDYSSFPRSEKYYGNITELMDTLIGKQLEVYALFPIGDVKALSPIDMDTKGIIPFEQDNLCSPDLMLETIETTNCPDPSKMFVISANPAILNYYEQNGVEICRINNGYNDVINSNAHEINHVKKLRKILR